MLILFGGGLDSGAVVEWAIHNKHRPFLLYIDYGAKASHGEMGSLTYFVGKHALDYRVIGLRGAVIGNPLVDQSVVSDHALNYIPGRNLLFASIGLSVAASRKESFVAMGFHLEPEGSVYADAKPEFVREVNTLTRHIYGVEYPSIYAPFIARERADYLTETVRDFESRLFDRTFSCYESSTSVECGRCTHCIAKSRLLQDVRSRL